MRPTSLRIALGLAAALVAWHEPARADVQAAVADSLFQQGRALLEQGRVPEACAKFAESHRIEPAGGTLLNLALCHEQQGRLATAHAELGEALAVAIREQRVDRQQIARSRIDAIAPRLPHLTVEAEDRAAEIAIDGNPLPASALGVPFAVDPGDHQVTAWEAGKQPITRHVRVEAGRAARVHLPALREKHAESARPAEEPTVGRTQKHVGVGTMVGGGVVATGGLVVALLVSPIVKTIDAASCGTTAYDPEGGASQTRSRLDTCEADADKNASGLTTGGFVAAGIGAAAALAGGVLLLSAPRKASQPRSQVGIGPGTLQFSRSF